MQRSDEYRTRAAQALRLAAASGDSRNKVALLSIANGWIKLARLTEVYGSEGGPHFKPPAESRPRKGGSRKGKGPLEH
jgi:hypothetical protein